MSEVKSVTVTELAGWAKDEYIIVDMREELAYSYGHIPNAINIPISNPESVDIATEYKTKRLVIYCQKGILSEAVVNYLNDNDFDAYQLSGGYLAWLMRKIPTLI
jgi:rhodanese-related sulfurtransferase